jgi:para-aminobenzoate synthetase component I
LTKQITFEINNLTAFKTNMLNWANQFNIFCLLDSQHYHFKSPNFDCLLAVGNDSSFIGPATAHSLEALQKIAREQNRWLFGHINYDVKNAVEALSSNHFDGIELPAIHFFEPTIILKINNKSVEIISSNNPLEIFNAINTFEPVTEASKYIAPSIKSRFTKEAYIDAVKNLQNHIAKGDCYEVNFCQEFYAENITLDAIETYHSLMNISPNPFAALYKFQKTYCICASPERYFKKNGQTIISQPIKGTSKRAHHNHQIDEANKQHLLNSEKEKSENVMVVDLVRNDLSKICKEGSVKVDELFGVYSFPQVHQMISTISGQLDTEQNWVDIVTATFPMGSMTGAPKKRVMELIEQYELTKRGLFSGTIGYVQPNGDADFNVVIRSILYNEQKKYLSFQTGSAITFLSDAEQEYEECLLKAAAIKEVLTK